MTGHQLVSPAHLSHPSASLQDRPFRQQPIAVAPSVAGHAPLHLKNPRTVNGDSVPSLTSSARARSHHCRALSSLLYICSVHHLLLLIASPRCRTSCFHLSLCPRRSCRSPHLLLCAAPVQAGVCRAEAESVFVLKREGGESPADT